MPDLAAETARSEPRIALPFDAMVLAGGASSRLGSVAKAELVADGATLLERTLAAVSGARRTVVVGPEPSQRLPAGVLLAREDPAFGGPASAIAAGLAMLAAGGGSSDVTLVLACDMPNIGLAVPRLVRGLGDNPEQDGVIAVEADRLQWLASGFRTARLASAIGARGGALDGMPVVRLLDGLNLVPIDVPPGSTADVDTWDDARRLGVIRAGSPRKENA